MGCLRTRPFFRMAVENAVSASIPASPAGVFQSGCKAALFLLALEMGNCLIDQTVGQARIAHQSRRDFGITRPPGQLRMEDESGANPRLPPRRGIITLRVWPHHVSFHKASILHRLESVKNVNESNSVNISDCDPPFRRNQKGRGQE